MFESTDNEHLRKWLTEFSQEYSDYQKNNAKVDSSKKYYDIIVNKIPSELRRRSIFKSKYKITGSVGQGNLAQCPWIGIFNQNITQTATYGIYVVYLYSSDLKKLFLTLNQGFTTFERLFKRKKFEYIARTAHYFAEEINHSEFIKGKIKLGNHLGILAKGYESGTIIYKEYNIANLPSNDTLIDDLYKIMDIYDEVAGVIECKSYDEIVKIVNNVEEELGINDALMTIREEMDKTFIVPHDAHVIPKKVEKTTRKENKFSRIKNNILRKKLDYVNIARVNARIGLQGEKLALEIERERLEKLGIQNLDSKIKWLSDESDSYGYDIESVDIINGKESTIFIEVKTTMDRTDTPFFISKREKDLSDEKDEFYRIYRIFDCDSLSPKYYIADGKVENNFFLDAITFQATYKYNVI